MDTTNESQNVVLDCLLNEVSNLDAQCSLNTAVIDDTDNQIAKDPDEDVNPDVTDLRYSVEDHPPFVLSVLLALQNVLLTFGIIVVISVTIADLACADRNDPIRAKLFCTAAFMVGLTTIVQSACGIRLPVFQGISGAFMGPLLALRTAGIWNCDNDDVDMSLMAVNQNVTIAARQEMVYFRVTQLQGSLMASATVTEVLLGATGLLGYLVRRVGPITVCVTIMSIGLSLYPIPVRYCGTYLPVAVCATALMIVFILYLTKFYITMPTMERCRKSPKNAEDVDNGARIPIFQTLAIFLTVIIVWALCGILTLSGVLPDDPSDPAYHARTDTRGDMISMSPWFFFPYPGFVSAFMSSCVESIGDYMIVSKVTATFPPPLHAINRGILTEGVLGVVAGALGAGHATTSHSSNTVLIKLTKVASRSVMVLAGVICLLFGVIGKFGAVMASLPAPVIGGVSIVNFGLLVSIGLSSLQKVDLSSTRNLAVLGTSLYLGLVSSEWLKQNKEAIDTGYSSLDQVLRITLGTQMFVAGLSSIILDNTVTGTNVERGIDETSFVNTGSRRCANKQTFVYDVPGVSKLQRTFRIFRHIPFIQPYRGCN